ncbi:MAG TPA: ATP synthase F1 subunit gamma [Candidatus Limnocylindrales bacterium]|nr:ATP synthase F1 subunit gamma [Candidatus Limnocylindrales bacterium]
MASRQQIKRRIGSVKSTRQITRAMQLMAASKLRRAQDAVAGPREYSAVAREILTHLRHLAQTEVQHPLFAERPVKRRLIIAISSDQGLAGAYDANIARRLLQELSEDRKAGRQTSVITIGRKVSHVVSRIADVEVMAVYTNFADNPDAKELRPLLSTIYDAFKKEEIDAVELLYTRFKSTVSQVVEMQRLLPAGFEEVEVSSDVSSAKIEPSIDVLIESSVQRLLEVQMYQARLEAVASEQSMRMIAMKNATDNAGDIIDDLTLEYNNARQAAITQELAEITGGAEALNG